MAKLVVEERESEELRRFLHGWPGQASSVVVDVELHRVVQRHPRASVLLTLARVALDAVTLVALDERVVSIARSLPPSQLRALDAVHLASALSLGDDLGVLMSYDRRLIAAAEQAGVPTASPGS